jgi:hypothetical protein
MLFAGDQPQWEAYMCAGVFVVKNTRLAREFFDEWLAKYDPTAWNFDDVTKKWTCSGEWAGPKYEQGSACELVQSEKFSGAASGKSHVLKLPWYQLNNHNYKRPNRGFAMHFAGIYKLYIEPYFSQQIK